MGFRMTEAIGFETCKIHYNSVWCDGCMGNVLAQGICPPFGTRTNTNCDDIGQYIPGPSIRTDNFQPPDQINDGNLQANQ